MFASGNCQCAFHDPMGIIKIVDGFRLREIGLTLNDPIPIGIKGILVTSDVLEASGVPGAIKNASQKCEAFRVETRLELFPTENGFGGAALPRQAASVQWVLGLDV